jgi:hypothetical protein
MPTAYDYPDNAGATLQYLIAYGEWFMLPHCLPYLNAYGIYIYPDNAGATLQYLIAYGEWFMLPHCLPYLNAYGL